MPFSSQLAALNSAAAVPLSIFHDTARGTVIKPAPHAPPHRIDQVVGELAFWCLHAEEFLESRHLSIEAEVAPSNKDAVPSLDLWALLHAIGATLNHCADGLKADDLGLFEVEISVEMPAGTGDACPTSRVQMKPRIAYLGRKALTNRKHSGDGPAGDEIMSAFWNAQVEWLKAGGIRRLSLTYGLEICAGG